MKGKDRNTLCWCGSGKKFKKCHLNRDLQHRENPWAAVDLNRRAFTAKKCFASNIGLGQCDGSVIKAHTVSRGPNLAKIAADGHVLQYNAGISKNACKLSLKEIGISNASVFLGFCSKHDRELFACLENEPFNGRSDQCLTVAYRIICRELYNKDAAMHLQETLRNADKGLPLYDQLMLQNMLDQINTGNEAARQELKTTHHVLTTAMVDSQPNVISSLIIEFAGPLPFMFAGAWSPITDFHDKALQQGYADELLEQIFVSSFALDTNSMVCISWRNIADAPGKIIAGQLQALQANQQASASLQLATKHIENIFFDPDWFKTLDDKQKQQLSELAMDGLDEMGSVPSKPVRLDIDFKLPTASRSIQV